MKNFTMQAISQGREIFAVCHNFPRIFPAEMQRLGDWGRLSGGCKEVYRRGTILLICFQFSGTGLVKKISGACFSSLFRFVYRAKKIWQREILGTKSQDLTRKNFPRSLFNERGTTRNISVHRRP